MESNKPSDTDTMPRMVSDPKNQSQTHFMLEKAAAGRLHTTGPIWTINK
jgi:hypothetical protein